MYNVLNLPIIWSMHGNALDLKGGIPYCIVQTKKNRVFKRIGCFSDFHFHRWPPVVYRWPCQEVAPSIGGPPVVHRWPIGENTLKHRWPPVRGHGVSVEVSWLRLDDWTPCFVIVSGLLYTCFFPFHVLSDFT